MERRNWENKIEKLVSYFSTRKEGEVISYTTIEKILGLYQQTPEFIYIVSRTRAKLIENSIITKAIMFEGIKILESSEVAGYIYEKYLVTSLRKQETALEILKYLDKTKFNNEELKELKELQNLILNINTYSTDEVIKSQLQLSKAKTLALE